MIDFHYWPTPNGWKIAIMLEECNLPYRTRFVNIGRGEQFEPSFLAISPNNRMPAIVDHDPPDAYRTTSSLRPDGRMQSQRIGTVSVFESGAILRYLAEKTGRFLPGDEAGRKAVDEWLFWQVGNLGPAAGHLSHFVNYAEGDHPYAHTRFANEYHRCLGVLEQRLQEYEFIAGEYSIADMASWPWVLIAKPLGQPLEEFPAVSRWRQAVKSRAAVQRGVDLGKAHRRSAPPDEKEREILYNQRARG